MSSPSPQEMHPLPATRVLLVWGGWEGHQPETVARILAARLEAAQCAVEVVAGVAPLATLDLTPYAAIVPVWSWGSEPGEALPLLLAAVEQGVGLATFHGGIDWFVDWRYAYLIGGHFLFHPPEPIAYSVHFSDRTHPITAGQADFAITTEQYYLHVDPGNQVLATTCTDQGVIMPVAWVRSHGAGRVFYCSLAHTAAQIEAPPVLNLLTNGFLWAARHSPENDSG